MHVARLRQKLSEYYRIEGVDDPIFVDLPKGGFKVVFEAREIRTEPADPPQILPRSLKKDMALVAALVVAIAMAGFFGMKLWALQRSTPPNATAWTPELKELWEPLVSTNRPLIVCLSLPNSATGEIGT